MTQDEIIRMARDSEVSRYEVLDGYACTTSELLHFAYLIAAHEREACAKVCEEHQTWYGNSGNSTVGSNKFIRPKTWAECAAAIRARSEK